MAISSTPSLLEIEAEFGASGLVACANEAGLSLPVSMLDFVGLSAETMLYDAGTFYVDQAKGEYAGSQYGSATVTYYSTYIRCEGTDYYSASEAWVSLALPKALTEYNYLEFTWDKPSSGANNSIRAMEFTRHPGSSSRLNNPFWEKTNVGTGSVGSTTEIIDLSTATFQNDATYLWLGIHMTSSSQYAKAITDFTQIKVY